MFVYFSMCLEAASPHERSSMVSGAAPAPSARVLLLDREDRVPSLSVEEGERTRTISFMRVKSDSAAIVFPKSRTKAVWSVLEILLQWLGGQKLARLGV